MITARVMKMMTKQSTFNGSGIFCRCKSRDSAQRYIGQEVCFATNPNTHRITFYETSGKILFQTAPIIQAITTVENGTKIVSFKSCMGDTYSVEPENAPKSFVCKESSVKVGMRIVCDKMEDDPRPIEEGSAGTVTLIDDIGQIHVSWDNGRSLALVPGVDKYHTI